MMKKIVIFFLSLFAFGNSFAQQSTDTVARPRLIVTIAIDGLRSDYLSRNRGATREPLSRGFVSVFRQGPAW